MRRHGVLEKPEERTLVQQLFRTGKEGELNEAGEQGMRMRRKEVNPIEEGIRRARKRGRNTGGESGSGGAGEEE